jgi:cytochrome c2
MSRRAVAVAGLGVLAAALVACGARSNAPADPASVERGRDIYLFESCASCHGTERQGTRSAPELTRLYRHWTDRELAAYLRSPRTYPKDRRLAAIAERFPAEMAGLPAAGEERLRDLIAYLLSR